MLEQKDYPQNVASYTHMLNLQDSGTVPHQLQPAEIAVQLDLFL